MKSLNKKSVKGRGLVKTAVFICFMFTMIFVSTMLARGEPVKADGSTTFKAFCWADREKFINFLKNGSESDAPKYSLFGAKFNTNKSKLYVDGGPPIKLDERCDRITHSDGVEDKTAPYRYWFWVKANRQTSNVNLCWRTLSYIATGEPLTWENNNYNAKQYDNGKDSNVVSAPIQRLTAKSNSDSFYVDKGRMLNDRFALDFYLIDIKEWYERGGTDSNGFNGYLYLQSVIGKMENGKCVHTAYSYQSWCSQGWSNRAEFLNHYNQVLPIDWDGFHDVYFYRVVADEERPVYGHCNPNDGGGVVLSGTKKTGGECKRSIRNYTAFQLKDIKTYEKGGKKYYLKGIAVYPHEQTDKDGNPQRSFYLTHSVKDKVFASDGDAETDEYSKTKETGRKKDKLSGQDYKVTRKLEFSGAETQFVREVKATSPPKNPVGLKATNPDHFTGKQTVKDLRNRIQNLWIKSGCEHQDVYLVYESKDAANISVTAQYYNHDDDKSSGTGMGQYVLDDEEDPVKIGKLSGDDNKFDLKIAREIEKEKILDTAEFADVDYDSLTGDAKKKKDQEIDEKRVLNNFSEHGGVMYTARSVVIKYTNTSGNETYAYLDGSSTASSGTKPAVKDTSLDAVVKSASGNKFKNAVWPGKTAEQGELLTAIGKALDKIKITDMDKSEGAEIIIRYYQPLLPAMKLSYLNYEDNSGEKHSLLVSADKEKDLHEVFCNNGEGSLDTARFGSYEYEPSVTVFKDKATGMLYTESGLAGLGVSTHKCELKQKMHKTRLSDTFNKKLLK